MHVLTVLRDPIELGDKPDAPREAQLAIAECDVVQDVITRIIANGYLAGSGNAAWVIDSNRRRLAVFSRQWAAPCFLVPPNSPIVSWIFPTGRWQLYFSYLPDDDPETVYRRMKQS